jgi:hypothetical protein
MRHVVSVADPECLSRIPDPTFFHPRSRIRIKEFKYFNLKKWFLSSRKYDPGCLSRIPDPDPYFLPIPDPGSRGQKGTGSRIRIRQHCITSLFFTTLGVGRIFFEGDFFGFSFYVRYSARLHLPPFRFHRVGGCCDRTQDSVEYGIGC